MALTPMDLVAAAKQRIREVGTSEVQATLGDTLILDVREPEEYAAGHLPGAVNIPRGVVEFRIETHPIFQGKKDAGIIVYCQSGLRSALAADILQQLGWSGTVSMAGGFKAWSEGGLPVSS